MSRFVDFLTSELTGRKFPKPVEFQNFHFDRKVKEIPFDSLKEYQIEAAYRMLVRCMPQDLPAVLDNSAREIREVIYGELRGRLIRLQQAIHDRDFDRTRSELDDIMREVFG